MENPERRDRVRELEQEFNRLFVRRRFTALQLAREIDPEIEPASYSVLATLQHTGPSRMTFIARHLGIGKPTLSRQLNTLAARGFVTKTTDPEDGRAQVVSLTVEGRHRLETAQADRAERYLQMLAPWSEEEITTLSGLLAKLNRTYAAYDDETGFACHARSEDGSQELAEESAAGQERRSAS
ncbi:MarR family winged helix-turn-helix transcriptional regulator [Nesterenkonia flava]|uniref:MarR family transcriptional regulator n=1 Tax=Nesterenkonia flava TaxID=469799 RepID=A0ABU1FSI3_9MICC|nr:MarR family transcriptional regulator [Nesterenkonia flava]MDR5711616.1 MarR family transcriptional regulator [Nesterenkonia flava]